MDKAIQKGIFIIGKIIDFVIFLTGVLFPRTAGRKCGFGTACGNVSSVTAL